MKKRRQLSAPALFLCRGAMVGAVYFAMLLPSQLNFQLLPGTEVRIAAFVPVVGGILWGWPAALGVAVANLLSDLVLYSSNPLSILAGSLLNGLSAMAARRLFYALPGTERENCVFDFASLMRYLVTCLVTQITLCAGVAMVLNLYSGLRVTVTFPMTLANNMASCILLGLPLIILAPRFLTLAPPSRTRREPSRHLLFLLLVVPSVCMCHLELLSRGGLGTMVFLSILFLAVFDAFAPEVAPTGSSVSFRSVKALCFRWVILCSVGISVVVTLLIGLVLSKYVEDKLSLWRQIYRLTTVIIVLLTSCFSVVVNRLERHITTPLSELTSRLRTDDQSALNEMEVLSERLDFVAEGKEALQGNEYTLYVGLTARDGSHHFSPENARRLIGDICLSYVTGYISATDASGGYRGAETAAEEDVLVYTIFGANDGEIRAIADDVLRVMEQEAVLIEKNRLTKWYYRGNPT